MEKNPSKFKAFLSLMSQLICFNNFYFIILGCSELTNNTPSLLRLMRKESG